MKIDRAPQTCPAAGFTLIEVVIGLVVMGISVVALYGAITSSYDTIRLGRENLRATQILTEKIEAIRLYDWDQITAANFIPKTFTAPFDPANTNAPGLTYTGTILIKKVPQSVSYADDMRSVKIDLQWSSRGLPRSRQFNTYVCRTGIQGYHY